MIEDRLQVVVAPLGADVDAARSAHLLPDDVLVLLDVLAEQHRRAPIVVHHVARERPHDARLGAHEHAVQAQAVSVRLPPHRDHAVVVVGEVQLQHLAGRQVQTQRLGDLVGFVFGAASDPDATRRFSRAQGAPGSTERLRPGR
jgi:hypothetical protein